MIVLSKEKLSQMVVGAVICPIKTDCCFETRFSKQVKGYLMDLDDQFERYQYTLSTKNVEIGETYRFEISKEVTCNWQNVYFVVVQDFLHQLTFTTLSDALTQMILDLHQRQVTSICVSFLSLGYFGASTEAAILVEGFLRAFEKEPQIAQMKIVVKNDSREEFDAIIEAFEGLPKQLYRKPRFLVDNQNHHQRPFRHKKQENF